MPTIRFTLNGKPTQASFEPGMHLLDVLREDYSHRRLGFEPELVDGWFEKAGLKAESYRTVEPPRASLGKLTVSIWLAIRPDKQMDKMRLGAEFPVEEHLL